MTDNIEANDRLGPWNAGRPIVVNGVTYWSEDYRDWEIFHGPAARIEWDASDESYVTAYGRAGNRWTVPAYRQAATRSAEIAAASKIMRRSLADTGSETRVIADKSVADVRKSSRACRKAELTIRALRDRK